MQHSPLHESLPSWLTLGTVAPMQCLLLLWRGAYFLRLSASSFQDDEECPLPIFHKALNQQSTILSWKPHSLLPHSSRVHDCTMKHADHRLIMDQSCGIQSPLVKHLTDGLPINSHLLSSSRRKRLSCCEVAFDLITCLLWMHYRIPCKCWASPFCWNVTCSLWIKEMRFGHEKWTKKRASVQGVCIHLEASVPIAVISKMGNPRSGQ